MVFSDKKGNIYRHPSLRMVGSRLNEFVLPRKNEVIALPKDSLLFYLPNRFPAGFNIVTKEIEVLKYFEGRETFAVGAFPIPGYLRTYIPAYIIKKEKVFPLWAYTACGFYKGRFCVAAKRVDRRIRQSPRFYDNSLIQKEVRAVLKEYPLNRLYRHLANCAVNYNCLAAKNLFLKRWEAPLPTARFCNARCVGCLSHQESDCSSSHERITFRPNVHETEEVMFNHLSSAREAIVSFGQGCEGEPLLEADLIVRSVDKVRQKTNRGTINMNTNASLPKKIETLCKAGIDSFRVSLNSPREKFYNLYFRPVNYKFGDVVKSIQTAKRHHKFVSINLFVFPGFTDSEWQIKWLIKFIKDTEIDMIQWRNLNIDPESYLKCISSENSNPQGVLKSIEIVRKKFPELKMGYFNIPKEQFSPLDKNDPFFE